MDQAPSPAHDGYLRQPNRCATHIRKFMIVIAGILSSIAGAIGILVFWIIF